MGETERRIDYVISSYSDLVYKLAYAQTKNKSDADDVYQEVFLRYIKKSPDFSSAEHEKAWFIRVTLNCCKKLWNAPFWKHTVPLEEDIPFVPEEVGWLKPLVDQLPKAYRVVVHLYYYEDLSTAQISQLLNRKESTVRVQLMRSRELLRDVLEGEEIYAESGL